VNAFHVCGGLLALWALVVSYLGVTRENFPATDRAMRLVGAVSVVLVMLAIASAIYTGATEKKEPTGEPGVILPLL
jgi:formate-dependent nitrite reductase membrane component NrfD